MLVMTRNTIMRLYYRRTSELRPGPEVIDFFVLNSAEHEILNAHKYINIKKFSFFQAPISL